MPRKKQTENKEIKPEFTLTLTLHQKDYVGKGATIGDAMVNMPTPPKIMGKGVLHITNGTLEDTQVYYPNRLKRFFHAPLYRQIQSKQLYTVLKPIKHE